MFKFSIISLAFTVLANTWLAWLVFRKNKKNLANIAFSLIAYSVSFWALTNIATQLAHTVEIGVIWAQISYLSAILVAFSFAFFVFVFPNEKLNKGQIWFLSVYLSIGVIISLWPGFLLKTVELDPWKNVAFTLFGSAL